MTNAIIPISPEGLEIAQTYLTLNNNIDSTAETLGISPIQVQQYLEKPEIKRYIDAMYLNAGFRNRSKIAEALDKLISKKIEELEEADIGSSKDIAELIMMAHKVRMDEIKAITEAEKITVKNQTNIQINSPFGEGNYGKLLDKLLNDSTEF